MGSDQSHLSAVVAAVVFFALASPLALAQPTLLPGPVSVGVSLGAPTFLNFHVRSVLSRFFEVETATGGLVLPLSTMRISVWNLDATMRYFHRGSIFFIGLTARYFGLGIDGSSSLIRTDEAATDETPKARLGGVYIVPSVGLRFQLRPGLSLFFDLGLQLPLVTFGKIQSSRATSPLGEAPSQIYVELERASGRALSYLARTTLPTVSLFRLSWEI